MKKRKTHLFWFLFRLSRLSPLFHSLYGRRTFLIKNRTCSPQQRLNRLSIVSTSLHGYTGLEIKPLPSLPSEQKNNLEMELLWESCLDNWRQWANWFGCNHLGTETGWDLLSGPCGVRLIFNSITRNVKQCLKALAKSPEAPSGAFDVLGVDVVIFWNFGRNIFLIATVSRFSVECGCVFCVLNVSVRTVIHTDRSFAENLSSAVYAQFHIKDTSERKSSNWFCETWRGLQRSCVIIETNKGTKIPNLYVRQVRPSTPENENYEQTEESPCFLRNENFLTKTPLFVMHLREVFPDY